MITKENIINKENVRPLIRYLARTLDLSIFFIFFFVALNTISRTFNLPITMIHNNPILLSILPLVGYVLVEPIFLSSIGTTFGRWLLNIKLTDCAGKQLTFFTALQRSFFVWLYGCGAGMPIISFVTLLYSYFNLTKHGSTVWDRKAKVIVSHKKVDTFLVIFAIGLLGVINTFTYYATLKRY